MHYFEMKKIENFLPLPNPSLGTFDVSILVLSALDPPLLF